LILLGLIAGESSALAGINSGCRAWFRERGAVSKRYVARVRRGCRSCPGTLPVEQFNEGIGRMRAETQNLVEEIKQSVRLLRRHL
jgi:hypothetical protein